MDLNKRKRSTPWSVQDNEDQNSRSLPDISVVICVKNSENRIKKLFQSLEGLDIKEIVIVDGLSVDGTLDVCRKYTDIILSDEGKGLGHARQIGAEASTCEVIAYIDSDVIIPSCNIFQEMFSEMTNNDWVAINPQILAPEDDLNLWEDAQDLYFKDTFNSSGEKRYLIGMVVMVRKDIVERYPFDPIFTFGSEDTDFFHTLSKEGFKFGVSEQSIYHIHRSSLKEFSRQKISYGVGELKFILKHRTLKNLTTPFYILITGIFRSIRSRRISHIFFYILWSLFLRVGMLKGLFIYFRDSISKR